MKDEKLRKDEAVKKLLQKEKLIEEMKAKITDLKEENESDKGSIK